MLEQPEYAVDKHPRTGPIEVQMTQEPITAAVPGIAIAK